MTVSVRAFADFAALRAAFPTLDAAGGHIFAAAAWFDALARETLPAEASLLLPCASAGDASPTRLPTCLPLVRQGARVAALSNYYTGLYAPVAEQGDAASLAALCRYLRTLTPRPATFCFEPLDAEDAFYPALRAGLARAGYWTADEFCFGNWYLPSAGLRFAEYFAGRPSVLRNTVKRGRQRLDRAGHWEIAVHTGPGAALERAVAAYEEIYRKSWKPSEGYPNFIRALCALAARRGCLRLGLLSLDGRPLASQLWLFDQGVAYIFKLAYDPDAARFSPGSVLTTALMEHALERDQARVIDYLSGDDAYKQDWMSHRRERRRLLAFDPATPRGLLAAWRWHGGRVWRRLKS